MDCLLVVLMRVALRERVSCSCLFGGSVIHSCFVTGTQHEACLSSAVLAQAPDVQAQCLSSVRLVMEIPCESTCTCFAHMSYG